MAKQFVHAARAVTERINWFLSQRPGDVDSVGAVSDRDFGICDKADPEAEQHRRRRRLSPFLCKATPLN
jgi:hypothetical protein